MGVGNLFTKLILLFTVVPLVELFLLFQIAKVTGWGWTFILVLLTGLVGAYMAKKEGRGIWNRIQQDLSQGRIPGDELVNGLCVLIGGVFLITPGVLTDLIGFSLVFPSTRIQYIAYGKKKFASMVKKGNVSIYFGNR